MRKIMFNVFLSLFLWSLYRNAPDMVRAAWGEATKVRPCPAPEVQTVYASGGLRWHR